MVRIEYTRKSGFVNNIQMKNETYTDILKEYGSVREWLETIIHEGIAVTIEDFGTHGETRSIAD